MLRYRRSSKFIILFSIAAILLAACGSTAAEPVVQEELPPVVATLAEQPEVEVVDEAPGGELAVEEQVAAFTPGYELGSSQLVSTDPSTVSLASGEIQVLEFFAFW